MEGVGHSLENLLETDHLVEKTFNIAGHDMLLTRGNGIRAMLKGSYWKLVSSDIAFKSINSPDVSAHPFRNATSALSPNIGHLRSVFSNLARYG